MEFSQNSYFNAVQSNNEFDYDYKDMELDKEADYTTDEESVMSDKEAIDLAYDANTREEVKAVIEKNQSDTSEADKIKEVSSMASDDTMEDDADLDARVNVMPRSIYEYLDLDNLKNTNILDKAADTTYQEPLGTVENILVKIDKFEFPCDFVVTNMPDELGDTIILGRPFLESTHAQIDVFKEEISLGICEDKVKFDMNGNSFQSNITIERIYMASVGQEEESFNPLEIGHDLFSYESPACLQFEQDIMVKTVECGLHATPTRISATGMKRSLEEMNMEHSGNRTSSTTTVSDKYPYNISYPIPIPSGEWDTRHHATHLGGTSNQGIPNDEPIPLSLEHSEFGEKSSEPPKLQPIRPHLCDYLFEEWLKVKIGHTTINNSDREIVFNEWILDSFDVEEEYAREIDDVWEKCEQYHKKTKEAWHDEGFKEDELWRSGDEKTDYEPPYVLAVRRQISRPTRP
ncbi:BYPASS-related protein [Tanacetum coccineum]